MANGIDSEVDQRG